VNNNGCGLGKKWPGWWVGPGAGGLRYTFLTFFRYS
jgi:hypothetical protein